MAGVLPSKLYKLKKRLKRDGVFDPEFICWCFDKAVQYCDSYVENYANKYDSKQHGTNFNAYFQRLFEDRIESTGRTTLDKLIGMFGLLRK